VTERAHSFSSAKLAPIENLISILGSIRFASGRRSSAIKYAGAGIPKLGETSSATPDAVAVVPRDSDFIIAPGESP